MKKDFREFIEKRNDPYDEENWNEEENRFMVVIGDWSSDGHGYSDYFVYKSNYNLENLRQGYKDSCRLTGIQFNHNNDYIGNYDYRRDRWKRICTEYEDNIIDERAVKILNEHGVDLDIFEDFNNGSKKVFDPEQFSELILKFIKISLTDLKWEEAYFKKSEINHEIQPLNSRNRDLNVQFGYGIYKIY